MQQLRNEFGERSQAELKDILKENTDMQDKIINNLEKSITELLEEARRYLETTAAASTATRSTSSASASAESWQADRMVLGGLKAGGAGARAEVQWATPALASRAAFLLNVAFRHDKTTHAGPWAAQERHPSLWRTSEHDRREEATSSGI